VTDSGRGGSGGERDDRPDEGPDEEIVGADWLLEQLSGGRRSAERAADTDGSAGVPDDSPADADPAADESADAQAAVPAPLRPRKARWSWQTGMVEPVDDDEVDAAPDSDATAPAPVSEYEIAPATPPRGAGIEPAAPAGIEAAAPAPHEMPTRAMPIVPGGPQSEPGFPATVDGGGALSGLFTPPSGAAVPPTTEEPVPAGEEAALIGADSLPADPTTASTVPETASTEREASAGSAPTSAAVDGAATSAGFAWNLSPTDEPDPVVHGAGPLEPTPEQATSETNLETRLLPVAEPDSAAELDTAASAEDIPLTRRAAREAAESDDLAEGAEVTQSIEAAAAQPFASRPGAPAHEARARRGGRRSERSTRILFWVAAGLLAVLVIILLFVLGTRVNAGASVLVSATTRTATRPATPSATPTPTPTAPPTPRAAAAVGTHRWDALAGGECLQPYASPWAERFTVVACAQPHAAQLVVRGSFSTAPTAAYPGAQQLASQINLLCSKPGVINLAAAGALDDVQVQGAYPATAAQWSAGQRSYFCFASRASGKPITGSLTG
jgi:hypothetical protein